MSGKFHLGQTSNSPNPKTGVMIFSEILIYALLPCYFLATAIIPESWIDTAFGMFAYDIARQVNPFLSESAISFAKDERYFIHCHVLATWMLTFIFAPLVITAYGGFRKTMSHFTEVARKYTVWFMWILPAFVVINAWTFIWLGPSYPMGRAQRAVWEHVVFYAGIHGGSLSLAFLSLFFAIPLTWKHVFKGDIQ